ncbi:MAG TPA: hypothetical protein VMU04_17010 [Candidatus Acidoferrum sp.]|nr:hypothetical protein [Candidatus Acidoferrum sp.]
MNGLPRPPAGMNRPGQAPGAISGLGRPAGIGPSGINGMGRAPGAIAGVGGRDHVPGLGGLGSLAKSSAITRNPSTYAVNRQALSEQANRIRNNYHGHDCFRGDWWGRHRGAWQTGRWAAAAAAYYGAANWTVYYGYCGYYSEPYYYDYGSTVIYEGENVYTNGDAVATQQQYAEQAMTIAETGIQTRPTAADEWLSLGVFAMTQGEQANGNDLFQLAVNKSGVIRGNYYNALTDTTVPVYGSVDQGSQRAAWTVGGRRERVFEAGFANLAQSETTMLVHFGKDRTQQWTLVRMDQSTEAK